MSQPHEEPHFSHSTWFFKIKSTEASEVDALLSAEHCLNMKQAECD